MPLNNNRKDPHMDMSTTLPIKSLAENSTQSYPSNPLVSPRFNLSISPITTHSAPAVYPSLSSNASSSANSESAGMYKLGMNNGRGMAPGTTLGGRFSGDAHHQYGGPYRSPEKRLHRIAAQPQRRRLWTKRWNPPTTRPQWSYPNDRPVFRKSLPVTPAFPSPKSLTGPKPRPLHHLKPPLKQAPRLPPPKTVHTTQSG